MSQQVWDAETFRHSCTPEDKLSANLMLLPSREDVLCDYFQFLSYCVCMVNITSAKYYHIIIFLRSIGAFIQFKAMIALCIQYKQAVRLVVLFGLGSQK